MTARPVGTVGYCALAEELVGGFAREDGFGEVETRVVTRTTAAVVVAGTGDAVGVMVGRANAEDTVAVCESSVDGSVVSRRKYEYERKQMTATTTATIM